MKVDKAGSEDLKPTGNEGRGRVYPIRQLPSRRQPGARPESCWNDCWKEEREETIRPCVPSHVAYEVERGGNEPFKALGQCTYTRKSGIGTARGRCICQHKVERA